MHKRNGQIVIFVVLVALLGLTIVLSIASRAVSDIKQATFTDAGVRAYAAAEAGARYVLNAYTKNSLPIGICAGNVPTGLAFPGLASLTYQACGGTTDYALIPNLSADDVTEVDVSKVDQKNIKGLYVVWTNNNAGVEVEVLGRDYSLRRFAWAGGPAGSFPAGTNLYPSMAGTSCVSGNFSGCTNGDQNFSNGRCSGALYVSATDPTVSPSGQCPGTNCAFQFNELNPPGIPAKTIRIKALNAATSLAVCSIGSDGKSGQMGLQTLMATVSAVTANNVTKKIQVSLNPTYTPAIFDNAIYSGGDLTK